MFRPNNWLYLVAFIMLACSANRAACQAIVTPYRIYVHTYHTYDWDARISYQIARLKAEEVKSAKLDNRRKEGELLLWERGNLPTMQDNQERDAEERLRHSRATAFDTEIYSGYALNVLLTDAVRIYDRGLTKGDALLSPDVLRQIDVTSGRANANIGIIRNGKPQWPILWRSLADKPEFAEHFQRIDELVPEAVKQAKNGDVEAKLLDDLGTHVDALDQNLTTLSKTLGDKARWSSLRYADGRAFLQRLNEAIKVLERPGAGRYFNGVYEAKGRTIADLVQYMKEYGLQFAPALAGSEQAYRTLYFVLRDYDEEGGTKTRPRR